MNIADLVDKIVKSYVSEYGVYVDLINDLNELVAALDDMDFSKEYIAGANGIVAYVKKYASEHNRENRR